MERWGFGTIYLRRACQSDLPFFQNLYKIDDIAKYCGSVDNDKLCIKLANGNGGSTFIIENGLMAPIGYLTIFTAPLITGLSSANWLQYAIAPMYRNCGYATDAVSAIIEQNIGPLPIALLIDDSNYSSIRVAEKCGFSKMNFFDGVKPNGESVTNEHCWLKD